MKLPKTQFVLNKKSKVLDIVLQGGSYGIESPFMQKVINTCQKSGHSVLAFNFPYYDRGEDHSSGLELAEELDTLEKMMEKYKAVEYKHIRFVAKSLGAIVASYFLRNLPATKHQRYSIIVLGYVLGSIDLIGFLGKITIIQGQNDKFGGINKVKRDLKDAISKDIHYFEIPFADHSFRDPKTKDPLFEDEAITKLQSLSK